MTEKTVKYATRHLIDPLAFCGALALGPLLVTALTFWLMIPVIALVMGGPVYLLVAVPVLMWWLSRRAPSTGEIAVLGFVCNLIASGLIWAFYMLHAPRSADGIAWMYLGFGSLFAPLWAASFAMIYRKMRRPFFTQTV